MPPPAPPTSRPPAAHDPLVRPLLGLVGAQTVGMFLDTLLKMAVVLILVGPERTEGAQQTATSWAFLAYTTPFVLLSIPGGVLADRWSKRSVLLVLKAAEVLVMLLAGFALWVGTPWVVLGVLTLLGILSALGSPSKYGMLPELLPEHRLTRGNGFFLLASWVATILGTGMAGWALDLLGPDRRWQLGVGLAALAVLGLLLVRRVPPVPPAGRSEGVVATFVSGWRGIAASHSLKLAVTGSALFWTLGALLQQNVIVYGKSRTALHLSDTESGFLQAALAVGIGLGGWLCGHLTHGRLGTRWIHRGTAILGALLAVLGLYGPGKVVSTALLLLVGMSCGLVLVPLNSMTQGRSPPDRRGAVIAVLNVFVFSGVLVGSTIGSLLGQIGLASTTIFLVGSGAALLASVWARSARARLLEPAPDVGPA